MCSSASVIETSADVPVVEEERPVVVAQIPHKILVAAGGPGRVELLSQYLRRRDLGRQSAPIAVTRVRPLRAALLVIGPATGVRLGAHQLLRERREHLAQQIRLACDKNSSENEDRSNWR